MALEDEFLNKGRLSSFLGWAAVHPPKLQGDGMDPQSIILVRPDGDRGTMLVPTHVTLNTLVEISHDEDATKMLESLTIGTEQAGEFLEKEEGKNRLPVRLDLCRGQVRAVVSTKDGQGSHSANVIMTEMMHTLAECLLNDTRFRYYFDRDSSNRMVVGVVTSALWGHLRLHRRADVVGTTPDSLGSGIVGVHLLCFELEFQKNQQSGRVEVMYLSERPIVVRHGDEKELAEARRWCTTSKVWQRAQNVFWGQRRMRRVGAQETAT